jgi:acetoin utilization deacetylase AcuC-like enzyme
MPQPALVYHEDYDLNFGDHVFPSVKYRLIREQLISEGLATEESFHRPEPARDEDLCLVHTEEWIRKLKHGTLSYAEILRLEVPYSQRMVQAFWLATGGTILAARLALEHGIGLNIGGGFHHAFPGHGEGFCAIHDVGVAVRKLQQEGLMDRAMIIDADVHHGNGTAAIFSGDASVFTLSIHQFNNYPSEKPESVIDIHLPDEASDEDYLSRLREACSLAVPAYQPRIIFYIAGADPYVEDQLGGLNLTMEGLKERDAMVFELALSRHIPVAVTLAGGYARRVEDTVRIHVNTVQAAQETLCANPAWRLN